MNIDRYIKQFQSWKKFLKAFFCAFSYKFPSKKMIVIGVTGTKGKTSTANFIWATLTAGGYKTGMISTANIRIGNGETLNHYHMSMPKPASIQKLLSDMVKEGCTHCVIETTSQGIKSFRHIGIYYDVAVFTNLSPDHLLVHNNCFETYKKTKGVLFSSLFSHTKRIKNKYIPKISIINSDSEHANFFLQFKADKKIMFGTSPQAHYRASHIQNTKKGISFLVNTLPFDLQILGTFNALNALPAIIIGDMYKIPKEKIQKAFADLILIPGRMEMIQEGQKFIVLVDYAHEPCSMKQALLAVNSRKLPQTKTIVVLGAEGGSMDKAKRPIMGKIAAQLADYVVVTNVDPSGDDPKPILEDVANGVQRFGKIREKNLFVIEDRRQGIKKALSLANAHDIVLITGKGADQIMHLKDQHISWDDRMVVKEELQGLISLFDI